MHPKSILFVYVNFSTFVKADFDILSTFADVTKYQFTPGKGIVKTGIKLVRQFFFLIMNIRKFDAVYIWFADYHSLLPTLLARITGKKSFVVIGGYEVARIKSLKYGVLCSKFRGFFCVGTMKICSLNLTVSNYIDRKVRYIARGAKRHMVPNCVDMIHLQSDPNKKGNQILTIGIVENQRTFFLKGFDTFIDVARCMPDYRFVIIGINKATVSALLQNLPENITILGQMAHEELTEFYATSKYYCQLSRSESFGVSVAEAMLHGCIPVVTNVGGLPEVVGSTGFIVQRDPVMISQLIRDNSIILPDLQRTVSNRILSNFSREKRAERIRSLVS